MPAPVFASSAPPVTIAAPPAPTAFALTPAPRLDRAGTRSGPLVTEASVQEPSIIDVAALTADAAAALSGVAIATETPAGTSPGEPMSPLRAVSTSAPLPVASLDLEPGVPGRDSTQRAAASTVVAPEPRETIQMVGLPENGRIGVDLTIPVLAAIMVAIGFYLGSQRPGAARRGRQ